MRAYAPKGIVLSGGPASVLAEGSPRVDRLAFELGRPGARHLLRHAARSRTSSAGASTRRPHREYGPATIDTRAGAELFEGLPAEARRLDEPRRPRRGAAARVRAHRVARRPRRSPRSRTARRRFFGVQFHPEVVHTPRGKDVLRNFAYRVCGCSGQLVDARLRRDRGRADPRAGEGRARHLRALRRGRLGGRGAPRPPRHRRPAALHLRRQRRAARGRAGPGVEEVFGKMFHLPLVTVDAADRFLDEARRRHRPGAEAEDHRARVHRGLRGGGREARGARRARQFLVQGTLYPDVIESVSFKGPSAIIKSHHNVGGLPERDEARARRAAARAVQGRGAAARARARAPERRSSSASRSPGRASRSASSARSPRSGSRCCARRTSSCRRRSGRPASTSSSGRRSRCSSRCGASA